MPLDVKHLRVFVRSPRMFGSSQRGELQSLADLGQQDLGKELEFESWDINTAETRRDKERLQVASW